MSLFDKTRQQSSKAPIGPKRLGEIQTSFSYRFMQATARVMDRYCLDPIIGFLLPGYGDVVTALLVAPFLYVSAVKVRSLPLTLAMLCNVLLDVLVGLLPFFVGTVLDFVSKSYTKNAPFLGAIYHQKRCTFSNVVGSYAINVPPTCLQSRPPPPVKSAFYTILLRFSWDIGIYFLTTPLTARN